MSIATTVIVVIAATGGYVAGRLHEARVEMEALTSLHRTTKMVRSYMMCTSRLAIGYHEVAEQALGCLPPDDKYRICLEQEIQTLDTELAIEASKIKAWMSEEG